MLENHWMRKGWDSVQLITVLVSAAGSPTMPGQIKCFRNNGERNIRIVGTDMADDDTIKQMVDVYYRVSPVNDERYVDEILEICKREKVDIYFPNISAEVTKVSKRIKEFESIKVKVSISDASTVAVLNNKLSVYTKLKEHGIKIPEFYAVSNVDDFLKGCKDLCFPKRPVCLKMLEESGSRGVRIIDNQRNRYQIFAHEKPNSFFTSYEDMLSVLNNAESIEPMMLIPYFPGNEYTVDLLADHGKILYIVGRENVVSLMSIAQKSIVAKIESAYELCSEIVKLFDYTGNIGIDFLKDENGHPWIMDINPRLTATVSVIAAAGVNLPYLRVKQLLEEKMPKCDVQYGTTMIRRYAEYMTSVSGECIVF